MERIWNIRFVTVMSIVIEALGKVPKKSKIRMMQKSSLLDTARFARKYLGSKLVGSDLISRKITSEIKDMKNNDNNDNNSNNNENSKNSNKNTNCKWSRNIELASSEL